MNCKKVFLNHPRKAVPCIIAKCQVNMIASGEHIFLWSWSLSSPSSLSSSSSSSSLLSHPWTWGCRPSSQEPFQSLDSCDDKVQKGVITSFSRKTHYIFVFCNFYCYTYHHSKLTSSWSCPALLGGIGDGAFRRLWAIPNHKTISQKENLSFYKRRSTSG